ncbi:branched-chain amino acid ABC transporter permease [Methylobacterium oxalidis]|uniref:branched-chain amino acid ABC transporter permease n=1 Tax=Methylobacterium oxalidis TaxID=944322 RepID=UPI003314A985
MSVGTPLTRAAGLLVLPATAFLAAAPVFVTRSTLQDLCLVFLLAGLAQCWNLMAGYAGLVSVGQQAFVGLGGYVLFALAAAGFDPLLAVPVSALAAAFVAVPVGFLVFRMHGPYFAVITWVVADVLRLLFAQAKWLGGGSGMALPRSAGTDMLGLEPVMTLFGVRSAAAREILIYWAALTLIVAVTAGAYFVLRSRLGLALAAVRDGETAAASVGVGTTRAKFQIYLLAAFGASLAGALIFLQKGRISPDAAFSVLDWTAYVIFIVVIGGIGTLEGPILGAVLFVLLQSRLADLGPWYLMGLGALGISVMLVAPRGIWGTIADRFDLHLFPTRRRLVSAKAVEPTAPREETSRP